MRQIQSGGIRRVLYTALSAAVLTVFLMTFAPFASPAFADDAPVIAGAEPFTINIPQAKLDYIAERVRTYPFPTAPENAGWKYGIDAAFLHQMVNYWRDKYDWRKAEREMNRFHHYRAKIDGQYVHFVYEKGSGAHPKPLLLLHGWPYSFYEFLPLVEKLAHPERFGGKAEDGFDVIVPSLPGVAFSEAPKELKGLHFAAKRLHRLMTEMLGYKRYLVQGGDQGDVIGVWLARDYPQSILGLHENMLVVRDANAAFATGVIKGRATNEERAFMRKEKQKFDEQSAYFLTHLTRGETLAAAIADSPVGQAAWIAEKYYYWTDKTERPFEQTYSMDTLLTNIMLYVATDTFETSLRHYIAFGDTANEGTALPVGEKITVPVACAVLPRDGLQIAPPRSLLERSRARIVQWTVYPGGGHFPFREQPDFFVEDIRKFARQLGQ